MIKIGINGFGRIGSVRHLDKCETAWPACITVHHQAGGCHLSVLRKQGPERIGGGLERQIGDIHLGHDGSLQKCVLDVRKCDTLRRFEGF